MNKKEAVEEGIQYLRLIAEVFEEDPTINEVTIYRSGLVPIDLCSYKGIENVEDTEITNEEWLKEFTKATQ
jgi:hypothetical protein